MLKATKVSWVTVGFLSIALTGCESLSSIVEAIPPLIEVRFAHEVTHAGYDDTLNSSKNYECRFELTASFTGGGAGSSVQFKRGELTFLKTDGSTFSHVVETNPDIRGFWSGVDGLLETETALNRSVWFWDAPFSVAVRWDMVLADSFSGTKTDHTHTEKIDCR